MIRLIFFLPRKKIGEERVSSNFGISNNSKTLEIFFCLISPVVATHLNLTELQEQVASNFGHCKFVQFALVAFRKRLCLKDITAHRVNIAKDSGC